MKCKKLLSVLLTMSMVGAPILSSNCFALNFKTNPDDVSQVIVIKDKDIEKTFRAYIQKIAADKPKNIDTIKKLIDNGKNDKLKKYLEKNYMFDDNEFETFKTIFEDEYKKFKTDKKETNEKESEQKKSEQKEESKKSKESEQKESEEIEEVIIPRQTSLNEQATKNNTSKLRRKLLLGVSFAAVVLPFIYYLINLYNSAQTPSESAPVDSIVPDNTSIDNFTNPANITLSNATALANTTFSNTTTPANSTVNNDSNIVTNTLKGTVATALLYALTIFFV